MKREIRTMDICKKIGFLSQNVNTGKTVENFSEKPSILTPFISLLGS